MESNSRQERERLKEEYKEHFRKMKDVKEKVRRSGYINNVNEALQNMDTSGLLSSADQFLYQVRQKMIMIEARLDVAMDQLLHQDTTTAFGEEAAAFEESLRKKKTSETLNNIKRDMGLLYRELEEQANEYRAEKTIGRKPENPPDSQNPNPSGEAE